MASRHSHAPTNDQQIEYELRVPRSGTYIMKPTASCEAAQLWVRAILPPHIVPRRVGCSKFRYKSDIKSARIQLVKLLTFNTLYCEIVL